VSAGATRPHRTFYGEAGARTLPITLTALSGPEDFLLAPFTQPFGLGLDKRPFRPPKRRVPGRAGINQIVARQAFRPPKLHILLNWTALAGIATSSLIIRSGRHDSVLYRTALKG